MKIVILFLFLSFYSILVFSQSNQLEINEYSKPVSNGANRVIVISMPYGKYDVSGISGDTIGLHAAGNLIVDVVCTDYPSSASLSALNNNRLETFFKLFPYIQKSQVQSVNFLRQTNGSDKDKASAMFHGVVIQYWPKQSEETMKSDAVKLDEIMTPTYAPETAIKQSDTNTIPKSNGDSIRKEEKFIKKDSTKDELKVVRLSHRRFIKEISRPLEPYDLWQPIWWGGCKGCHVNIKKNVWSDTLRILSMKEAYKKKLISEEFYYEYKENMNQVELVPKKTKLTVPDDQFPLDSLPVIKDTASLSGVRIDPKYHLPDSTVFNILQRNKWGSLAVVGDVTGSMYPYTAQLLLWLKLNSIDSLTKDYVFFNDGDDKPDNKKKTGSTGGIYYQKCDSFDAVRSLIKSTMEKGNGGDIPENDIEALLKAQDVFPEARCLVLIADNWAPIKDKILINRLHIPVRVVLCGAREYYINLDYLNLALKTNGSLHFIGRDIYDLAKINEGATITIGDKVFKIVNGVFVDVTANNTKQ